MKKCFLFFVLLCSVNLYAQRISALGNFIIENDDINYSRMVLIGKGFVFLSDSEMKALGHNPLLKIIGTKGTNPSNSMMVVVTAKSQDSNRVKFVTFICSSADALLIEDGLFAVGYKEVNSIEYIENKKINVTEVTYQRIAVDKIDKVIVKYAMSDDGMEIKAAEATFERKESTK